MHTRAHLSLLVAVVLAVASLWPVLTPRAAADVTSAAITPGSYYLALGDSLAYGLQPDLDQTHGYADDYAAFLEQHYGLSASNYINMGCPAETTTGFIDGYGAGKSCPTLIPIVTPVKYRYTGPQLTAATTFLAQHPGQVNPITLDIGANDLLGVLPNTITQSTCAITFTPQLTQTILQGIATFSTNFKSILTTLKQATSGNETLLVMTY